MKNLIRWGILGCGVVEAGPVAAVFREPKSEYTRSLLAAAPGRSARFGHPLPADAPAPGAAGQLGSS